MVAAPVVVPDGGPVGEAIRAAVDGGARLVLTTGGTGLTPTDRTPEATRELLDFEVPGIPEALRAYGLSRNVHTAVLSRGVAGRRGDLPGHQPAGLARGVKDAFAILRHVLVHAVEQVVGSDH